ncbi:MAG: methylmalonyl-CoA mutase, partial [Saprospiraceae bacterium]|nr:methylmalonyl-CoA mutase [Saprospiraceae bacterium]
PLDDMPVFGTIASQFNDPGMNALYHRIMVEIVDKTGADLDSSFVASREMSEKIYIIPPNRTRYLSEISENNRSYDAWVDRQVELARKLFGLKQAIDLLEQQKAGKERDAALDQLRSAYAELEMDLDGHAKRLLDGWEEKKARYAADEYVYQVRGRDIRVTTFT